MTLLRFLSCSLMAAAALLASIRSAHAGQAMAKYITPPANATQMSEWSRNPSSASGSFELRGFRSASDGQNAYQTGNMEGVVHDGWIAKTDTFGNTLWSKSMREIIAASPYANTINFVSPQQPNNADNRGFLIYDVIYAQNSVYVCGQSAVNSVGKDGWGYVARLTPAGALQTFTFFTCETGGFKPTRAVALASVVSGGNLIIGVAGDFEGNALNVVPNFGPNTSPAFTMNGRMDNGSVRDVFGVTFNASLTEPQRGWTLGFNTVNDFASAVALDGDANLMVAMDLKDPDGVNNNLRLEHLDDDRSVWSRQSNGTYTTQGFSNFPDDYDFAGGDFTTIVKVNGNGVALHAEACRVESGENGSTSHITDMVEDGGSLYVLGHWSRHLRPSSSQFPTAPGSIKVSNGNSQDVFMARLSTTDFGWQKIVALNSPNEDVAGQLVLSPDAIYVTGSAGGSFTFVPISPGGSDEVLNSSSSRHLFWAKIDRTSFAKSWNTLPFVSTTLGIGLADTQRSSGLSLVGERILLTAANQSFYAFAPTAPITHSVGTAANRKTMPGHPMTYFRDGTQWNIGGVFNALIKPDGVYQEEVSLTITSAYGQPQPFKGTQNMAAGQSLRIAVPPIVYENAAGVILDATNAELLRTTAVTRRICTGYTVRNTTLNGTASELDYKLDTDSEITFLWRTEHAFEVKTVLPAGLTSEAAGTPSPVVNKHWIAEATPIIAQIDGSALTGDTGIRFRSTGYTPTGAAVAAGGTSGVAVSWATYQPRQQVPQFTLTGPATITYGWQREINLRVATVPAGAAGGATAVSGATTFTGDGEFWFAPGSSVTLTSPATRDSDRFQLSNYVNGTGSVTPSTQTASSTGVLSLTITLNSGSTITWNYAKKPVPQRVTIGDAIVWTGLPASVANTNATSIVATANAPAGTQGTEAFAWEPLGKRLLPLRPGKYILTFNDPALDPNSASPDDDVEAEVTAGYQATPVPGVTPAVNFAAAADSAVYQTYIAGSPAINLDSSTTDRAAWLSTYSLNTTAINGLALAGPSAAVNGSNFTATEKGTSVLVFTEAAADNVGRGDLENESLFVRVVDVRLWNDAAVLTADTATVASAITPPASHDLAVIGHNGYVAMPKARYNVTLHDNTTLQGPIFPVNQQFTTNNADKLVVTWFNRDSRISANWPSSTRDYTVTWPAVTPRIVIAGRLGSEGISGTAAGAAIQPLLTAPQYTNVAVYAQPDATKPGYNPNEEHAFIAPSFLDASRNAVFALQNGLNVSSTNTSHTSRPFVLVQYNETVADVTTPKMAAYAVEWEDAAVTDTRLPAYNQAYTPKYEIEAGKILTPPWPLPVLYGVSGWPAENQITNQDLAQRSAWQDRKKQWWAASGDTDTATEVSGLFYYPLRADFWHPLVSTGQRLSLNSGSYVFFNTVWPATIPVLKGGETLTHSGGEAFADGLTPNGLPSVVGMASAEVIYDEANRNFSPASMESSWVARVVNPLTPVEVDLSLDTLPDALKPAGGKVIVDGVLWRFKDVHAGIQKRLYYDSARGKLGFRGFLNGRTIGDRELTSAPPAINLLQPNIMTAAEKTNALTVSTDSVWTGAVASLFNKTRDPLGNTATAFTIGLGKDGAVNTLPSQIGNGLAVISNPELLNTAAAFSFTSNGYVTIAENNLSTLGDAPIALHIMKVDRTKKYRGAIAPIYPENVFDEKITLRHSGDFGGNVGDLVFQWYYREEDGTAANPPGVAHPSPPGAPAAGRWTLFGETQGLNEISLAGASAALLADNLFFCRWRHVSENAASYSDYAGAANSRPPVLTSPSVATDAAYVPQLAEGWVKRVTNAVNAFDARIRDFRNNDAPSTAVSMLQQAGGRWEGNVAFNPAKDVIENYGLIELYQTVLNRAADLSINLQPGTSGVNTALLNAANRIASLYTLLGNEAYADSQDPTIGFGTQSGEYGSLAPSIFCFQNQTGSLLEEELALLRGRGEIGARPAYNRLLWNFTNGQGEAAYALHYGITDMTNDGFLDHNDAAKLYPQGHGDAWGHYTMALRGYANLFRNANFAWDTRSELYQLNGVVFNVDYMDERAFAETAAARARTGLQIVDRIYRQKYTDNPAGQWQGYQDTNTDRAWGVYESAQRTATGAFFDWVTGNALLPSKDETKEGVTRVDRTTVPGLLELSSNAAAVQSRLDMADNALNPLGLDSEAVPFDIDPARTDRNNVAPATHFEQVYERAVAASQNAVRAFDHANDLSRQLRRTANSAEQLRQQTIDQDRDYRNRLIEILGTPYQGQIGAGKAYPAGYTGPDLFLHMYVDTVDITKETVPSTPKDVQVKLNGLMTLPKDTNPFEDGIVALPDFAKEQVKNWFPRDYNTDVTGFGESTFYTFTIPVRTSGYAFKSPADWGVRAAPGKAQAALAALLQAQYDLLIATEGYEGYVDDIKRKLRAFTAKTGIGAEEIKVLTDGTNSINLASKSTATWARTATIAALIRDTIYDARDATEAAVPENPLATFSAWTRSLIRWGAFGAGAATRGVEVWARYEEDAAQAKVDTGNANLWVEEARFAHRTEVIDMLEDLEAHVNGEPDMRLAIFKATEQLRSAGDAYRTILQEGIRLIEEREAFNKRVAATTTQHRYEDYTFRIARSEALGKFHSSFDIAARYAWLAGRAYSYELNLPDNHSAHAAPVLAAMMRSRTLGRFDGGQPVAGNGGLAEQLAVLHANFDHFKGQLGFNNPATQTANFSVRTELARIGLSSRVNGDWRTWLEGTRVADLWNYSYTRDGVDYGQIFRQRCRPFAPESTGPQPALVIPFSSTITDGENWFGKTLTGGDSMFTASNFATKIRASGVRFDSYNSTAMAVTPQVYLVPVGLDRMYFPESNLLEYRSWKVLDQRIPIPLAATASNFADASWQPFANSTSGTFDEARRYPAFRAYHDAGGYSTAEMLQSSRLVGRSVWNTQWVLIIPSKSILNDPPSGAYAGDVDAGLDTFIYGAPLPGFTHAAAGTTNRDGNGVRDIRLLLQTYSISGN